MTLCYAISLKYQLNLNTQGISSILERDKIIMDHIDALFP